MNEKTIPKPKLDHFKGNNAAVGSCCCCCWWLVNGDSIHMFNIYIFLNSPRQTSESSSSNINEDVITRYGPKTKKNVFKWKTVWQCVRRQNVSLFIKILHKVWRRMVEHGNTHSAVNTPEIWNVELEKLGTDFGFSSVRSGRQTDNETRGQVGWMPEGCRLGWFGFAWQ